jgi:hypothetical protein
MKTISSLIFFIFLSLLSFSQSLEGEWKGSFSTELDIPIDIDSPIKLYFKLKKDSSYSVYSYSKGHDHKGKDTVVVCKVLYQRTTADSVYLEETEVLKPANASPACFQKMHLTIRREKRSTILEGTWKSGNPCNNGGKIRFKKQDG